MIALAQGGSSDMVLLYRSERGLLGGNVEPVDFYSGAGSVDASLAELGYKRAEEWRTATYAGSTERVSIAKVTQ